MWCRLQTPTTQIADSNNWWKSNPTDIILHPISPQKRAMKTVWTFFWNFRPYACCSAFLPLHWYLCCWYSRHQNHWGGQTVCLAAAAASSAMCKDKPPFVNVGSQSWWSQVQFQFEKLISTFEIGILHALLKAFHPHSKTEVVLFTSQDLVVRSQLSKWNY